ncbi:ATP-grasp domain-containing protein [Phytoactinopolyspora halophila]|nr:ATP-grasp domain-containing protein [Phytoactinopolyspora halophila]
MSDTTQDSVPPSTSEPPATPDPSNRASQPGQAGDVDQPGHAGVPPAQDGLGAGVSGVEARISQALDQLRNLDRQFPELRHKVAKRALDAALISDAARRRGLDVVRLTQQTQIIRNGSHAVGFYQNMASPLTALDRLLTHDKLLTKQVLAQHGIPVARGQIASTMDTASAAFQQIGPPVAVKPITGSGGKGVTVDVWDEAELRAAADEAFTYNHRLLVEEMVAGIDLRIMTIAGRAVAAMLRVPANVVGDGTSSIRELIEQKNQIRAGNAYLRHCPITITSFTEHHLELRGLTPDSVPEAGRRVYLHYKANLSSGGDSYEIVDVVHPRILRLAEQAAARVSSAYHAGVDILLERFDLPPEAQRCIVCELNLNNEMPIHIFPLYGTPTATDDETIEGYFFRARTEIERGPHRIAAEDLATGAGNGSGDGSDEETTASAALPAPAARPTPDELPTPGEFAAPVTFAARSEATAGSGRSPRSPRGIDQHHLRTALAREGFEQVEYRGRLVHAVRDGAPVVFERSGRTMFASAVARTPAALQQLLRAATLPAVGRHRFHRSGLDDARAVMQEAPGAWRLRPQPAAEGTGSVRVEDVAALEHAWSRMPDDGTHAILEEAPTGTSCTVLMVDGEPSATSFASPPGVVGDGSTPLGTLIENKRAVRAHHPYLRHFPVKESLLTERSLARRRRHRDDVPAHGEVVHLALTPLMSYGADTIGLAGCPYPALAELSARLSGVLGQLPIMSVTFAYVPRPGGHTWAVWSLDPDPVVAHFALPGHRQAGTPNGSAGSDGGPAGSIDSVYTDVATALAKSSHYVLSST